MKYTVLLRKDNGSFIATVPVLPGCQTKGATEQEALDNVRTQIADELSRTRIVSVEIDTSQASSQSHAWADFAGMWKGDVTFEDFLSGIEAERRRIDADNMTA